MKIINMNIAVLSITSEGTKGFSENIIASNKYDLYLKIIKWVEDIFEEQLYDYRPSNSVQFITEEDNNVEYLVNKLHNMNKTITSTRNYSKYFSVESIEERTITVDEDSNITDID